MKAKLLVTAVALPAFFTFTSCKEKEATTEPAPSENKPSSETTPDKPEVTPESAPEMPDDAAPNVEEPTEEPQ